MNYRCTKCHQVIPAGSIICPTCKPSIPQVLSVMKKEPEHRVVMLNLQDFVNLVEEKEFWHLEALKWCGKLGEEKIRLAEYMDKHSIKGAVS